MQLWPLPFSVALLWGQVADSAAAGFEVYLYTLQKHPSDLIFTAVALNTESKRTSSTLSCLLLFTFCREWGSSFGLFSGRISS